MTNPAKTDACYSINRKAGYVTIYNIPARYPLNLWQELKEQHDITHQTLANHLYQMHLDGLDHE